MRVPASFLLTAAVLIGCSGTPSGQAPASSEGTGGKTPAQTAAKPPAQAAAKPPAKADAADEPETKTTVADWVGIYSSPAEIGGFSGTVLAISEGFQGAADYRMTFYSDVSVEGSIEQDIYSGSCLIDGQWIYVPQASGFYDDDKKPRLLASVERYARVTINGHQTLMRDDAYQGFQKDNTLYDYGILIRVSDKATIFDDLKDVEHKSVKLLYTDKTKPWKDPFVNGPNER